MYYDLECQSLWLNSTATEITCNGYVGHDYLVAQIILSVALVIFLYKIGKWLKKEIEDYEA